MGLYSIGKLKAMVMISIRIRIINGANDMRTSTINLLGNGEVTFRYKNSTTGQYHTITRSAVKFLWRVI